MHSEPHSEPHLESVFLDFCNTLAHEEPSRFAIYAEFACDAGVEISPEAMRELMTRAHAELPNEGGHGFRYTDPWFRAYIDLIFHEYLGIRADALPAFQERLFERFSDAQTFRLFPGARKLLASLRKRGLRIGIISNWSERLHGLLESMDLSSPFEVILSSAVERLEKPDPAIFELALERMGVPAQAALHAGDHLDKDCHAALAVGMRAVHVDHSGTAADERGIPRVTSLPNLGEHVLALIQ
jgi:REG-2-like HAD superfamily hydrolase